MNVLTKKRIIGLIAGGVLFASLISPFAAQAAEQCGDNSAGRGQHQMDPDKISQQIEDTFGISKENVLSYEKQGVAVKDLYKAAFLAKASGKSFQEVMQAKTWDNTWKEVVKVLSVTKGQIRATQQDLEAAQLENELHISTQTSLHLMQEGYRSHDIAVANELSPNTGKTIQDILYMKQTNTSWYDVAQQLGISDDAFAQDMKTLKEAYQPSGFEGEGF